MPTACTSTNPRFDRPWRAPTLVQASVWGHVAAAATVAVSPPLWPWALGALALDHALITATGLWPRSTWLGANIRRLSAASAARDEVSLTIDDGPDPAITPAVLDLLDEHQARATFFCIAKQAQQHPTLCREIVRRGHSVQNHSHAHAHSFSVWGPKGMARDIALAQDHLSHITGEKPRFFRAPAGLRNPFLDPVLHSQGLQLVSWTRRGFDTVKSDPACVRARLTRGLAAGDILLLHDGNVAHSAQGKPVILEVLPTLLRQFQQSGLRTVTLPQAFGLTD
jgi:peptidoglycan/xylan/chitin deacetylase (PgdA/CDA1 family)